MCIFIIFISSNAYIYSMCYILVFNNRNMCMSIYITYSNMFHIYMSQYWLLRGWLNEIKIKKGKISSKTYKPFYNEVQF